MRPHSAVLLFALSAGFPSFAPGAQEVRLGALDLSRMTAGWGAPQVDRSVQEKPLAIAGRKFSYGVGTHSASRLWISLDGSAERFQAFVGLDDGVKDKGSVAFQIYGDGRKIWDSGVMKTGAKAKEVDVPLSGIRSLLLKVDSADNGTTHDHADWAEARFTVTGEKPRAVEPPKEDAVILTPKPAPAPRINGPLVYGCRPGNPFLYRIPATGSRPMAFAAENLPAGLRLDSAAGILTGAAPPRGDHRIVLKASNAHGETSRPLTVVSGDTLALTPYMGWNHWYAHYTNVSDGLIRKAADSLVSSGMADAGYDYVCIDDCWMRKPSETTGPLSGPLRDEAGAMLPNALFPDMAGLTGYLHSKGLKAGIYSSPGPETCARYAGSWKREAQDAARYAEWGFDLLKYDLCSYRRIVPDLTLDKMLKPYALMGDLLAGQKRDILYNLCQYGRNNVWEWGADVKAQSWRTSGDLGFELDRIFQVAKANSGHRAWNGPGRWNDPDYLQIGWIGSAHQMGEPAPSPLSPNEQYSFMSLWALMAAPLVYSGDMSKLDEFTLNVLCNPEVIEINQDPLGQCASLSPLNDDCFLMVKEMEDGSKAVGLCNGGEGELELTAHWAALGVQGPQRVRDVWRHKDLDVADGEYRTKVPRHAVALLRFFPADSAARR